MKHFLCVVSKRKPIDSFTQGHIDRSATLARISSDFELSTFLTPHAALYAWSNEGSPNLFQTRVGALAYSGYVNLKPIDLLNQLSRWYTNGNKFFARLGGSYAIAHLNKRKEQVEVWNTFTRIVPVYFAESAEMIAVSTHALLTHLVGKWTNKPQYALHHLAGFLNTGYYNNELTPFEGVKLLPPNVKLTASGAGLNIKPIDHSERELYRAEPDSAYYDELTQSLIDAFQVLKEMPGTIRCAITGGKDSRLIAAVLNYMGVNFTTFTNGFEEHPDVVIGKRVAQVLQVPHTVYQPAVQQEKEEQYLEIDILNRTKQKVLLTCGMISAYENLNIALPFRNQMILGGQGGELIRGGYAKSVKRHDVNGLDAFMRNSLMAHADFLQPEVAHALAQQIKGDMERHLKSISVADLLDKYYLYYRCGRWSATARSAYLTGAHVIQPLFDGIFIKKVLRSKTQYRLNDRILYALVQRLAPELVNLPFFNDRWKFEKEGPVDGDQEGWKARSPLTFSGQGKSSFNWRMTCLSDMKEAFYELIFDSRSEPLFQIVNKQKVKGLFEDQKTVPPKINTFLWHLYTAAVLISDRWLEEKDENQVVRVMVPNQ